MATILNIAHADRYISLFSKGLKASGLEEKLSEHGPFTILAPVNLALGKLMSLSYEQLLKPIHQEQLLSLLSGYILVGKKMMSDFRNDSKLPAINGKQVEVSAKDGEVFINGAKILSKDRQGSNGVVHLLGNIYSESAT